jgi:Resolvase, N terminal domain
LSQKVEQSLLEAMIWFVGTLHPLGRDLQYLVNTAHDLTARGICFKVLIGRGASIDTRFPGGKLVFGIFAALVEFERELTIERTKAGMAAVRNSGRPYKMAPSKLRLDLASMNQPATTISDLCAELGITLRMRRSIRRCASRERRRSPASGPKRRNSARCRYVRGFRCSGWFGTALPG